MESANQMIYEKFIERLQMQQSKQGTNKKVKNLSRFITIPPVFIFLSEYRSQLDSYIAHKLGPLIIFYFLLGLIVGPFLAFFRDSLLIHHTIFTVKNAN